MDMKKINNLSELNMPEKHRTFLYAYLPMIKKLSCFPKIEQFVLFGSCARGEATDQSDIDLVALGEGLNDDDLFLLMDPLFDIPLEKYVANDILAIPNDIYQKHIGTYGMVQGVIAREGIDLYGLL
jgi:predicted nucleotidyltransferase